MYQHLDGINILRLAVYAKINYFHPLQISAQRYHDTKTDPLTGTANLWAGFSHDDNTGLKWIKSLNLLNPLPFF